MVEDVLQRKPCVGKETQTCSHLLPGDMSRHVYMSGVCHVMCLPSQEQRHGEICLQDNLQLLQGMMTPSYLVAPQQWSQELSQLPQAPLLPWQASTTQLITFSHPSAQCTLAQGKVPAEGPGPRM